MFGFSSFYSALVVSLFLLSIFFNRKNRKKCFNIISIILFIVAAFRDVNVGGDLNNYLNVFGYVNDYNNIVELTVFSLGSGYEIGFVYLCKLISLIYNNEHFFIFVTTFLSLIGPFIFIKRFSNSAVTSLFIYILLGFYNISFNSVKQSIAISFVLIALYWLLNDKLKHAILFYVIACFFHTSAIFSCLYYFLFKIKMKENMLKVMMLIMGCVVILGQFIINYSISFIFQKYADNETEMMTSGTGYGLLFMYISVFCFCYYLFMHSCDNKKTLTVVLINAMFLAVIFQTSATLMAALTRLTLYFYIPVCVLLPNLYSTLKRENKIRLAYRSLLILFYIFYCCYPLSENGSGSNVTATIPYDFYLPNFERL